MNSGRCEGVLAGAVFGVCLADPLQNKDFFELTAAYDHATLQLDATAGSQPGALLAQMLDYVPRYNENPQALLDDGLPADNLLCALPAGCIWQTADRLRQFIIEGKLTAPEAACAYLVVLSLDDVPYPEFLRRVLTLVDGQHIALERALLRVGHVQGRGSEHHSLRHLAKSSEAYESVPLAIYCLLRYADEPLQAIKRAVYSPGQRVITAGLVGAMCGARHGTDFIPAPARSIVRNYVNNNQS